MKNKIPLILAIFAVSIFVIPQVTFAAWWNPGTWKIFNRKTEVKIDQKANATSTPNNRIIPEEKATTSSKKEKSSTPSEKKQESMLPKNTGGGGAGATSGPHPVNPITSSASAISSPTTVFISSKSSIVSSPEVREICHKSYELNPKLLGNLVSEELVSLAAQLQSDCTEIHSGEQRLDINIIKNRWDSYQKLVNWDKSLLVTFISNPAPDSFRTLCSSADKVKTPFASTKIVLSPDRTSMVSTSVPYTLFDIMLCKDFSSASSTTMSVTLGLLQWDFDNNDSDELRTKIINYNNLLKKLELLENGDVVAIQNTIIPFIDQSNKHLITAKQEDNKKKVSFTVYNPVKWAKKLMNKPAEAMIGTGHINEGLVMHEPPDFIINEFEVEVMVKSVKKQNPSTKLLILP